MSAAKWKDKQREQREQAETDLEAAAGDIEVPGDDGIDAAGETPTDPIEALRAEVAELTDRNLRLAAELRNMQQRGQRERQESLLYAEADFAKSLLPVLDDFERTLASAAEADNAAAVLEGVRIVHEHLLKALKQRNIEPIAAKGERFDPDVHEALLQQPSDEVEAGIILEEAARGFRMHERVLRPAKVIVSSGPAAAANESQE